MALVMLAPYINLAARNLTKRNYKLLLAIMFFMDVTLYKFFYGENYSSGQSLFHFVYLYLIAGYIRIWKPFRCVRAGKIGGLWIFSVFSILIMETLLEYLKCFFHHDTPCFRLTVGLIGNNEFTLVSSLLFFMWMSKLRFNVDNCIVRRCMKIAPFTFAVYLIHDNNNVRPILWKWVLSHSNIDSVLLYAQLFGYSLGIFIVCLIIDYFLKRFMSCLHVDTLVDALTDQARTRLSRYLG